MSVHPKSSTKCFIVECCCCWCDFFFFFLLSWFFFITSACNWIRSSSLESTSRLEYCTASINLKSLFRNFTFGATCMRKIILYKKKKQMNYWVTKKKKRAQRGKQKNVGEKQIKSTWTHKWTFFIYLLCSARVKGGMTTLNFTHEWRLHRLINIGILGFACVRVSLLFSFQQGDSHLHECVLCLGVCVCEFVSYGRDMWVANFAHRGRFTAIQTPTENSLKNIIFFRRMFLLFVNS